jgi:hypothetical protein
MKAKEYFAKYDEAIWQEAHEPEVKKDGAMAKMLIDFTSEMSGIIKARNIKTDQGLLGLIEELNVKWNAVVNLFTKKYGASPIRRDGYRIAINKELEIIEG